MYGVSQVARLHRTAMITLVALTVGLAAAGSALAAPALRVEKVDTSHYPLVRVTVVASNPSALRNLVVTENGHGVTGLKLPNISSARAVALAVDTSHSMMGSRLRSVIRAATQFISLQHANSLLAVYGFGAHPYRESRFAGGRADAAAALRRVGVRGPIGTATYAVVKLVAHDTIALHTSERALVLVTDGQSYHDPATIQQAIQAARAAHLVIYPVVITTPLTDTHTLGRLASATGGRLVTASNTAELRSVYEGLSTELNGTYTFSYQSLASWGQPNRLVLSAPGLGRATGNVAPPRPHSTTTKGPSVKAPTSMLSRLLMVFGLMLGLGVVAVGSLKVMELVRR